MKTNSKGRQKHWVFKNSADWGCWNLQNESPPLKEIDNINNLAALYCLGNVGEDNISKVHLFCSLCMSVLLIHIYLEKKILEITIVLYIM